MGCQNETVDGSPGTLATFSASFGAGTQGKVAAHPAIQKSACERNAV